MWFALSTGDALPTGAKAPWYLILRMLQHCFRPDPRHSLSLAIQMRAAHEEVEQAVDAFAGADAGRSVVVESLRGAPIHVATRANVLRPAASLLKLPLVGAIRTAIAAGRLDRSASVQVRELSPTYMRSVVAAFDPDHRLSLSELCGLCLVTSDNPIAQHLLDRVGREAVNGYLLSVGCERTRLTGGFSDAELDAPETADVTTAREALTLLASLLGGGGSIAAALENNVRAARIPLRLPPGTRAPNKTGTLPGVVNDVALVYGEHTDLGFAFLCEGQHDPALTSMQIGDCVAAIRRAVGEKVRGWSPSDVSARRRAKRPSSER